MAEGTYEKIRTWYKIQKAELAHGKQHQIINIKQNQILKQIKVYSEQLWVCTKQCHIKEKCCDTL